MSNVGCSPHSLFKQESYRKFLVELGSVSRAIGGKNGWAGHEFLLLDAYAGPGNLPYYPNEPGSPLIALQVVPQFMPLHAVFFEEDSSTLEQLTRAVAERNGHCLVELYCGRFQDLAMPVIDRMDRKVWRNGLIYADPNYLGPDDPSLIDTLVPLAVHPVTYYLDILIHLQCTGYKRVRGQAAYRDQPDLITALRRIKKKVMKISQPDTAQQWAFILMTNFPSPKFGYGNGWYDVESQKGQAIVDRINTTLSERVRRNGYTTFEFMR